jgi:tRNA U38,U39,U40 pseudouridine synthase TruA
MIGTLIEFEHRKKNGQDIANLLASRERSNAKRAVPACGLYLNRVIYEPGGEYRAKERTGEFSKKEQE